MSVLQLVLCVVSLTVLLSWSAAGHVALRANLTHIDNAHGYTKHDLLRRMVARTRARVNKRWTPPRAHPSGGATLTASASRDEDKPNSEYLIHFGVGTPRPQHVALTLDTSSDLIWTQCGCSVCFDQPFPVLDSATSGTQRGVSCFDPICTRGGLPFSGCTLKDNLCFYAYSYPGNSVTTGKIYEDTFTFQALGASDEVTAVPNLRFGCGMYNKGKFESDESGIAGFGRGPMSLPSQLKASRFSHCFTTIGESKSSPVFLGTPANLEAQATGPFQSTPFVPSPDGPNSSLYYLSLKGVTVGRTRLPFDASTFALRGDGSGGTIIDSGTGITTFPRAVFEELQDEFVRQVPLPVFDALVDDSEVLCFSTSSTTKAKTKAPAMPKLILHLEGADWDLPEQNYVLPFDQDFGTGMCVVISSSGDSDITIIGNYQQQNMHMEYDLESNKLGFVRARCDKL
uniref:Uncharacterized protein n=1 Tax=Avena sativa TaxID=4498 RepID=A0ACD6ANS2_AVESA